MKKQNRRKPRRRKARRTSSRRPGDKAHVALEPLLTGLEELSERELLAIRTAVPRRGIPRHSAWIRDGVRRAAEVSGLAPLRILDRLTPVLERCYREQRHPFEDSAVTLAQLELARRTFGAPPSTITVPEVDAPGGPTPDDARRLIAAWEAESVAMVVARPAEDERHPIEWYCASHLLVGHLSAADGVPVRFDRLDAGALAAELAGAPDELGGIPRPAGYARAMLSAIADVYDRLADDGHAQRTLATELRRLALGSVRAEVRAAS